MVSIADVSEAPSRGSTQFIITLGRDEKASWKRAAEEAGLSMAEYVRRAVLHAADAPTKAEIAEARALAAEIDASVGRMEAMLDRTLKRIDDAVDPALEAQRRDAILADLERRGERLDLDLLVHRRA